MGYNLPAGVTQGIIDRHYDSPLAWVCEDPACGERWSDYPELWPCSVEGCEIAACPTCHSVCFSCNADLCSAHWTMADVGDGIRRYCAGCLALVGISNVRLTQGGCHSQ